MTPESRSVCGDWLFTFSELFRVPPPPLLLPSPSLGSGVKGRGVKGEVAGCSSWRRGAGVGGPLAQPLSLVWVESSLLLLLPAPPSSPAHLAAPRTLIWRENKNVFISQERRRTLKWNHRVKAQRGILGPHTGGASVGTDTFLFALYSRPLFLFFLCSFSCVLFRYIFM